MRDEHLRKAFVLGQNSLRIRSKLLLSSKSNVVRGPNENHTFSNVQKISSRSMKCLLKSYFVSDRLKMEEEQFHMKREMKQALVL